VSRPTLALPVWLALAVLLATTVIGGLVDPRPGPLRAHRAGWQVVEADLHTHTRFSDGFLSPFDLVLHARRQGLGAIAVTEHNVIFPALMARGWSRLIDGPQVIIGEEITTRDYHLLAFGLERAVDARLPLESAAAEVHRQGGVVIAAHPARRFWPALQPAVPHLDGVELVHPTAWRAGGWSSDDFHAFWEEVRTAKPGAVAIGTSDYHVGPVLGLATTFVFAESEQPRHLVDALRAGRTVVIDRGGELHGDPALVEAVRRDPIDRPRRDVGWVGEGLLDRIARAVASLALLALVALRRR
jgi:predicted metal-dependent phosphoesterase TrpH